MAKKKTVVQKIVDAVDQVLHPDQVQAEAKAEKQSSVQSSDYASHPKFDKFLKKGAE